MSKIIVIESEIASGEWLVWTMLAENIEDAMNKLMNSDDYEAKDTAELYYDGDSSINIIVQEEGEDIIALEYVNRGFLNGTQ